MYINFKKIFSVLLILAIGAGIGIGTVKTYENFKAPKQKVTVVGTGEVDATTDQATISIQVTNKKDALSLKDSLIKFGIPESRITQSSYNIDPVYQNDASAPELLMYPRPNPTTNINYTVVLNSIKNIKEVIAIINSNPNTQITDTFYSLNNRKMWESKAKEEAIKDARSQVESVAKINHLRVGKLVSLTDINSPGPMPLSAVFKGEEPTNTGAVEQDQVIKYREQTEKITTSYNATYEVY